MADQVFLNNISDDSKTKEYVSQQLMPRVFHNIPMNVLNVGQFSVVNEEMSQVMEQLGFTSAFYYNESFITKAVLPESIYAQAAIFNIGYSFANPSSCVMLLELKLSDIYNNATFNADSGLYEFILDKDTIINLSNGNSYSFDYDILIQYKNIETSQGTATIPAWSVRYINTDEANVVSINKKDPYIQYTVAQTWLCLYVKVREYTRTTYTVVNNMTNGIPNEDYLITTTEHICGFDVKYIDGEGNSQWLDHDHILALHAEVKDQLPYVHYIMDNPQTLRLKFQLQGNRYFVPALNSRYEIVVYTCHGQAANFSAWNPEDQPNVISNTSHYTNNGNVTKACHVVGASQTGTDIGTVETVRRETIEAYNTAKVISTDHDIEEWFKTFFFKNILYPFFYKRRDDPWGKIWAGFIALKDTDDTIFRTNTLHGKIPYRVLYDNLGPNVMHEKEIIIPPGWIWVYPNAEENRYTISPYVASDSGLIETAKTLESIPNKFVFANPFGIRIQKDPFAIGYFNPWVSLFSPLTKIYTTYYNTSNTNDITTLYHASPINFLIDRTYMNDYYDINTYINPSVDAWVDGTPLVKYVRKNTVAPYFTNSMWSYFKHPIDLYVQNIPLMVLTERDGYLPFIPEKTYFCVSTKNKIDDDKWALNNFWIEDYSEDSANPKRVSIPITGSIDMIYGLDSIWGDEDIAEPVATVESTDITITGLDPSDPITFDRVEDRQYYEMRVANNASLGAIEKIVVGSVTETDLTKYGESNLWRIGDRYQSPVILNVYFRNSNDEASISKQYYINNAADVYTPYEPQPYENDQFVIMLSNVDAGGIILYADMKPSATDGAIDHYRVNFKDIPYNTSLFYVKNSILPTALNNMRVVLHAAVDGIETGWVEMQPVQKETDGTYLFNIPAYPLNGLVDIDNRIHIASIDNGGGSWIPRTFGSYVNIDASKPEFTVSILIKTQDSTFDPGLNLDESFTGFRCVDQYSVDDISLVQELKEMRSVVNWGDSSEPTEEDIATYDNLLSLGVYDASTYNFFTIAQYYYELFTAGEASVMSFAQLIQTGNAMLHGEKSIDTFSKGYTLSNTIEFLYQLTSQVCLTALSNDDIINIMKSMDSSLLDKTDQEIWGHMYDLYNAYASDVDEMFVPYGVNNGVEIQLMPVVESALMTNSSFKTFVAAFTQVHTAIEPVIFNRLEGNNYLDCKLIATYGLPHSYCSDVDKELETAFWPNLDVQIAFDVKLYNTSLTMNTLNELRIMIKSYFNRLTTVHTPLDIISMDNNIYISQLIRSMESHPNVAYLKFKGWYTNEKGDPDGNYMNADYQAIVQKWDTLEEMPTDELERYVPEMFVLEDKNIVLNAI